MIGSKMQDRFRFAYLTASLDNKGLSVFYLLSIPLRKHLLFFSNTSESLSSMRFLLHYTQNMGDCQSATHISWANRRRSAHIFRLSTSLVYDSRKVLIPCGYHWLFHDFQQQRIDVFGRFALRDQLVSEPQERIFSGPEFFRI